MAWLEREACFVRRGTNNRGWRPTRPGSGLAGWSPTGSSPPSSRIARRGSATRICTGMSSSPTSPAGSTAAGPRSTAPPCTGRSGPSACCSRPRCAASSPQRLGIEWGPMHNDSAEIAGIPARVLREFSRRHEQIAEWLDIHRRRGPSRPRRGAVARPAPASTTPTTSPPSRPAGASRAEQLGWGPAQLDAAPRRTPVTVDGRRRAVDDPRHGVAAGESTRRSATVSFDEWVDWLLTTGSRRSRDVHPLRSHPGRRRRTPRRTPLADRRRRRSIGRSPRRPSSQVGDHWAERRRSTPPDAPSPTIGAALHVPLAARRRATTPRPTRRRHAAPASACSTRSLSTRRSRHRRSGDDQADARSGASPRR